jgi:hypothetical protein
VAWRKFRGCFMGWRERDFFETTAYNDLLYDKASALKQLTFYGRREGVDIF